MSEPIAVIGTGMAACGAAYRLNERDAAHALFDKGDHPGGHTKTYTYDDEWIFDDGPHVSFTTDQRIKALLAKNVDNDFHSGPTSVNNYWRGHWVKHPAQNNLYGLPTDLIVECISDFVAAEGQEADQAANYEEWLLSNYGKTFAENFPMKYTRKIHCTEAANLATDWIGPRLYRPSLQEVLEGALSPRTDDVHYIEGFRYPRRGGFFSYLAPFLAKSKVSMEHEVIRVVPRRKEVHFANGEVVEYSALVSTMPLPVLVPMIDDAPSTVLEAARSLHYTGCVFVNLGIGRELETEATWTYIYDEDIDITRLSFPSRFSPETAPPGCSSIQAEIYFSPHYKPLADPVDAIVTKAVDDLQRCGLLEEGEEILLAEGVVSPFANAIFDHERSRSLATVRQFLDDSKIATAGRFGEWEYYWTDDSFKSGERAADQAIGWAHG